MNLVNLVHTIGWFLLVIAALASIAADDSLDELSSTQRQEVVSRWSAPVDKSGENPANR